LLRKDLTAAYRCGGEIRYDVFIEIAPGAAPPDVDRLARLGVTRSSDSDTVVTARLSREDLGQVSELAAVRQVRLRRRLRHA
jgi:hypothetical protein